MLGNSPQKSSLNSSLKAFLLIITLVNVFPTVANLLCGNKMEESVLFSSSHCIFSDSLERKRKVLYD